MPSFFSTQRSSIYRLNGFVNLPSSLSPLKQPKLANRQFSLNSKNNYIKPPIPVKVISASVKMLETLLHNSKRDLNSDQFKPLIMYDRLELMVKYLESINDDIIPNELIKQIDGFLKNDLTEKITLKLNGLQMDRDSLNDKIFKLNQEYRTLVLGTNFNEIKLKKDELTQAKEDHALFQLLPLINQIEQKISGFNSVSDELLQELMIMEAKAEEDRKKLDLFFAQIRVVFLSISNPIKEVNKDTKADKDLFMNLNRIFLSVYIAKNTFRLNLAPWDVLKFLTATLNSESLNQFEKACKAKLEDDLKLKLLKENQR